MVVLGDKKTTSGSLFAVNASLADAQFTPPRSRQLKQPLYFPSDDHKLFAWLHWPTGGLTSDIGLVICKPFGYESICAHRSMRAFAETAAALGVPVLRFDYLGTGDSADSDPAAGQIEIWLRDVAAAADELRRCTGVKRVCLLGFRLGALLATAAAARGAVADALILVAPVLDGRRYLRELRTTSLAGAGAANASRSDKQAGAAGSMEVGGYALSPATIAQLSQLNVATLTAPPAAEMLIIDRDDLPAGRAWSEALVGMGVRARYLALPGFVKMMMTPPQFALVPQAMLQEMRSWLLQSGIATEHVAAESRSARAELPAVATDLALAGNGDAPGVRLHEHPVSLGAERMVFGIVTEPARDEKRRRAVILLNSGADYHIGAARMYVSMARRWARRGYVVLRMDLAGIGDSTTRPGHKDDEVFPPDAIEDMRTAVDYMRAQYGVRDVTLGGLCSAAYHTLRGAAAGLPVNRILMVNPQNLSWKEGMALGDLQLADVVRETRAYRGRWLSLTTWKRLLRGQIDVAAVGRVYLHGARMAVESMLRDAARRLHIRLPRDLGWELQDIVARGVRVVFVFGRGEAGIELLRIQGGSAVKRLGDRCRVHIIDSADHTFTQSGPRARLEQVLSDELFAPHA
jgi:alpha-beta hydrolase superfamily lysophospholipase